MSIEVECNDVIGGLTLIMRGSVLQADEAEPAINGLSRIEGAGLLVR